MRSPAGFVTSIRPSLFDIDGLPELRACLDSCVQDLFFDTQKALDVLVRATQDPRLKERTGSPRFRESLMKLKTLSAEDHDNLLMKLVLGFSDSQISRVFFLDLLTVSTIRHAMVKRYHVMFEWLENYRAEVRQKGYAFYDGKRKFLDHTKTADPDKRRQALDHAVRWLLQS